MSHVQQPKYEIVETDQRIEVRDYGSMIVAEVRMSGERTEAIGHGFRILADYIFGNNSKALKVSMTAPVTQHGVNVLDGAAPVENESDEPQWQIRFIMPAAYTLDELPRPNNPRIELKEVAAKRFAVIRFSGWATRESLQGRTDELLGFVRRKNLKVADAPVYAFYNPPWTLPFLRRNEVMVEIGR